ncbi:hypothetical protein ACI79C_19510 [Geodermatophilus sp. SYSU D00697]
MTPTPRSFSAEATAHAARAARLELAADRHEEVGVFLAQMYALIDRLDDVPLGDTPPATAFDARWEA